MSHGEILLIDGDTPAFRATLTKDENGNLLSKDEAIERIEGHFDFVHQLTDTTRSLVVLSDPDDNFRLDAYAEYKGNRDYENRPAMLGELKEYLMEQHGAIYWPRLEADDVQGIFATSGDDDYIVVSIDKDLDQIPGKRMNPNKWQDGIRHITEFDGWLWWWMQSLMGDKTDGFPGIHGMGPKTAEKILRAEIAKGADVEYLWDVVRDTYIAKGYTEEFALSQTRCARILRAGDYCPVDNQVRMWTPYS